MNNREIEVHFESGRAVVGSRETVAKGCRLVYRDGRLSQVFLQTAQGEVKLSNSTGERVLYYDPDFLPANQGPVIWHIPLP